MASVSIVRPAPDKVLIDIADYVERYPVRSKLAWETMGHKGMHYSLPSRELIADMVESVAEAPAFDGLILLTNCDKITPACSWPRPASTYRR